MSDHDCEADVPSWLTEDYDRIYPMVKREGDLPVSVGLIEDPAAITHTQYTISEFYRPRGKAKPTVHLQIGSRLWPQKGPIGEDSQADWLHRFELATGSFQSLCSCHGLSAAAAATHAKSQLPPFPAAG